MDVTHVVSAPFCPLHEAPDPQSQRVDEALCGWPLRVSGPPSGGWLPVTTHYGYSGFAPAAALAPAGDWADRPKRAVLAPFADVLAGPAVERLQNSRISEVIITNTLPLDKDRTFEKLTELSIAPLVARAVNEVFTDGSVTSLFD